RLPRPPVKTVDLLLALSIAVTAWVRPATPPPAITAAVHFTIGGRSVITAADTTVPAMRAAGVAQLSIGNPAARPVGSRHRQQLNGEFIAALLRDFRHGGPGAIAKVRKNQPAAYCKLLTLLCPRDVKVEHSGGVKAMSDEEIEQAIELIKTMLAAR